MKYMAVDTSTRHTSIAIADGEKILASRHVAPKKDLSLSITFDIERTLQKAGVFLSGLDGFVIGLGPGSFTSLRVGLSMLKAFIMVTQRPVVGVSSLDVIAMNVKAKARTNVCVISDARRDLLYCALYEREGAALMRKSDYLLKSWNEIWPSLSGDFVFIGDGIPLFKERIAESAARPTSRFKASFAPEKQWLPQAKELAVLGYQRLCRGDVDDVTTLAPLYLHPEDCQVHGHRPATSGHP